MKKLLLIVLLSFPFLAFAQLTPEQVKAPFHPDSLGSVDHFKAIVDYAAQKVDTVAGKGLSTNDFTNAYKDSLDSVIVRIEERSRIGHNHDDRYYTETEVDSLLAGKADTTHTHVKSDITDFNEADYAPSNRGIPAGGSAGQVLKKVDGTDYNVVWGTDNDSGGGAVTPSGDSYLDQYWHSPLEWEHADVLNVTLGANTQTGSSYLTLDDLGKTLPELKALFPDVAEVQAATALTDFNRGGTGDAQGVSVDYAVLQQLLQDHYMVWLPAQKRYVITHSLIFRTGSTIQGQVDRDDVNGSILYRADGANCDIIRSASFSGGWAISGALRNFGIDGNKANNTTGNGIVVKGTGETFVIDRVRSNHNPESGVVIFDRIAPFMGHNISVHRNGDYGFLVEGTSLENREIFLNTLSGDANYDGLIGIDAPSVSMVAINMKQEGDQEQVINVLNANALQLNIIGGSVSAYDIDLASNGPNVANVIKVNYNSGDAGFKNPVIKVSGLYIDPDWPNFLYDVVRSKTFDAGNNEYYNDMYWSRWVDKLIPEAQLDYGIPDYGVFPYTTPGNAMTFYSSGRYTHSSSGTIYINNYVNWNIGVKKYILVNASSQPSVSIQGSVPGPGSVSYSGENFAASTPQWWIITYCGVDPTSGNAIYKVNIQ